MRPKWLRQHILSLFEAIKNELPQSTLPPKWQPARRMVLCPVCKPCNNRLNEVFENPAIDLIKEMIGGSIIDLTPRRQVILAGWLVKSDNLYELARTEHYGPGGRIPRPEQFHEELKLDLLGMMETGEPPANTSARVAYVSPSPIVLPTRQPFLPPGWPGQIIRRLTSVNPILNVLSETALWPKESPQPMVFLDATQHDDRFINVWPPQITKARWPPRVILTPFDIDALRAAWHHHPDNVVDDIFADLSPAKAERPKTPPDEPNLPSSGHPHRPQAAHYGPSASPPHNTAKACESGHAKTSVRGVCLPCAVNLHTLVTYM